MCQLVESIRFENGSPVNMEFHNDRYMRSKRDLFGVNQKISLEKIISVPDNAVNGLFKCRVEYDKEIKKVEFVPYKVRLVSTLKIVENNTIDYSYKFTDRKNINDLFEKREGCDDIIIVKNGYITDSSFSNLVFLDHEGKWFTPSIFLLAGTRRESLIKNGMVREAVITRDNIFQYKEIRLINAMMDIIDTNGVSLNNVY